MGWEKERGGFMASVRSSMERRRVSNARVTALRHRKYQDLSIQREQDKIRQAKEILESRKRERDRLNAYMHSACPPPAKPPDPFKALRKNNLEEMYKKPPWTASLRSDYETLIKLREKETAVANSRMEIKKQPHYNMYFERKESNMKVFPAESDEPFLLNEEFEFHHDALEPESICKPDDTNFTSKGSHVRNELEDLEDELFARETDSRPKCRTVVGRDLLHVEPAVFREHPFNSLRPGPGCLPPKTPSPRVAGSPLKSCLKSSKEKQISLSSLPESPTALSERSSDRNPSVTPTSPSTSVANSCIGYSSMSVRKQSFEPEIVSSGDQPGIDNVDYTYFDVPFDLEAKGTPYFDSIDMMAAPELPSSRPTVLDNSGLEENGAPSTIPSSPVLPDFEFVRPPWSEQLESERFDILSCSGIESTVLTETRRGTLTSLSRLPSSDSAQETASTPFSLPPRYGSSSASWQEDRDLESSFLEECTECRTPPLPSPTPGKSDDKTGLSEEEIFITSLDSEAATTRLIAEVIAVQSRLEDCKLKPLDFREFLTEPVYPFRGRATRRGSADRNLGKDRGMRPPPQDHGNGLIHSHGEQALVEENFLEHGTDIPVDFDDDASVRESVLDEQKAAANASWSTVDAGCVDDHDESVSTMARREIESHGVEDSTGLGILDEMECKGTLEGTAWEITWKNEALRPHSDTTKKYLETKPSSLTAADSQNSAGSTTATENSGQPKRVNDQKPPMKHVMLQTDADTELHIKGSPRPSQLASPRFPTTLEAEVPHFDASANAESGLLSDRSLMSTESTSRYLNVGYRDLSGTPRTKLPKQHCFYSSQGLIETGYSQPRNSAPQTPRSESKHTAAPPKDNRHDPRLCAYHDSLGDKENYGMSGPDDQELSILASLERLDWKLAAISARAMVRMTPPAPSVISQGQTSTKSAPAVMADGAGPLEARARKLPSNPLRPSSVKSQKPPRNFRQRHIVGVTNKFHSDLYHLYP